MATKKGSAKKSSGTSKAASKSASKQAKKSAAKPDPLKERMQRGGFGSSSALD